MVMIESDIQSLTNKLLEFRDERDWEQFHNPKDLAIAITAEAGELLECFLWKDPQSANPQKVEEELADVVCFALLLASKCNIDLKDAVLKKIAANAIKYPIDKAKGSSKKYNEL
jgi:NTP pyrophosphatase (non-canonical NTP hydrolase)